MGKIAFPRTMRNLDPKKLSSALAENMRYLENVLNQTFNFDHDILSNVGVDDHHVKYTDAEVDTIVATHDAITDAHHAKYTDAEVQALIDATGAFGPWTPTYTNLTLGDGVASARYVQIGDWVFATFELVFGSTTTIDASNPRVSLPVAVSGSSILQYAQAGLARDVTGSDYVGHTRFFSTTEMYFRVNAAGGTYVTSSPISATVPFTWTTGDRLILSTVYEAA